MARRDFQTIEQLAGWLAAEGINVSQWGQGESKRLDDLWLEYRAGEAILEDDPPARLLEVAEIHIRRGDAMLIELEQEFADGRRRSRLVPPSEKFKGGEEPRAVAWRCLHEELGLTEENVALSEEQGIIEHSALSPSYPGLLTRYHFHTFTATADGLPDEDFQRENRAPGDPIRRHYWGWRGGE